MKICFIGFGNMAKALAKGLSHYPEYELWASAPSLYEGINATGIHTHSDNLAIVENANIVILAVKPAKIKSVWSEIAHSIPHTCLVITIAAGINLSSFGQEGKEHPMIRAMPNIAAAIAESATVMISNPLVTPKQKQDAERIFATVGTINWLDNENDMHLCTALSGSGPAYVFLFMEAMIDAAKSLGLAEDLATSLTLQTIKGALGLAKTSVNLHDLRTHVTSPAGTTAAAIKEFENQDFNKIVSLAIKAAFERSHQLGT